MFCNDVSLQIVLPSEASSSTAYSIPTSSMLAVETAAIVLGLMSDEVFLQ
jgi:hypothetical protein